MEDWFEEFVLNCVSNDLKQYCYFDRNLKFGFSMRMYGNCLIRVINSFKSFYRIEFTNNTKILDDIPSSFKSKIDNSTNVPIIQIDVDKNDDELKNSLLMLKNAIHNHSEYLFKIHTPELTYGCCGRYLECSDKKHCVMSDIDREYAKGCSYKKNLEAGKIFYGVNKNV